VAEIVQLIGWNVIPYSLWDADQKYLTTIIKKWTNFIVESFASYYFKFNLLSTVCFFNFIVIYIQGVPKKSGLLNISEKFYRKVFQTKVVQKLFKKICLLILSIWPWMASPKSRSIFLNETLLFIAYSCSLIQELSKTLQWSLFSLSTFWVMRIGC